MLNECFFIWYPKKKKKNKGEKGIFFFSLSLFSWREKRKKRKCDVKQGIFHQAHHFLKSIFERKNGENNHDYEITKVPQLSHYFK